jgi:hypothetical protein
VRIWSEKAFSASAVLIAMAGASCGYHVGGKADLLPKSIQTICIPAFANATTRYKLTDRLPEAVSREFISRTRYRIVPDPNRADAILKGTVLNYGSFPTVFDPVTGRASAVDVRVYLKIELTERTTGKVLFTRPNYEARERYEVSAFPGAYFDESDAALDRVSKQVAQQVVTSILENF